MAHQICPLLNPCAAPRFLMRVAGTGPFARMSLRNIFKSVLRDVLTKVSGGDGRYISGLSIYRAKTLGPSPLVVGIGLPFDQIVRAVGFYWFIVDLDAAAASGEVDLDNKPFTFRQPLGAADGGGCP